MSRSTSARRKAGGRLADNGDAVRLLGEHGVLTTEPGSWAVIKQERMAAQR